MGTQFFCNESLAGDVTIKESLMYSGFYLKNFMDFLPKNLTESKPNSCTIKAAHLVAKKLIQIYVILLGKFLTCLFEILLGKFY